MKEIAINQLRIKRCKGLLQGILSTLLVLYLMMSPVVHSQVIDSSTTAEEVTTEPVNSQSSAEVSTESTAEPVPDATLPHDLSPWGMFMAADWVVKAVMIGLAIASLVTWTVGLVKFVEISWARRRANRVLDRLSNASELAQVAHYAANRGGPAAFMVRTAEGELAMSEGVIAHVGSDGLKDRLFMALSRIQAQAGSRLSKGTGILATIGSTSPFVGLFGTVWGIMNSFIGISQSQTTNLAVVAPGIAEALLATAIGLVAAIPAVILYNVFARSIGGYRQLLADNAVAIERLVSRDLDRLKAGQS